MRRQRRRVSRIWRTNRATDRLPPGEGELPLDELFDALPDDIPISVEVPRSIDAGRTTKERAVLAGDAARAYLAKYRARRT